MAAQHSPEHLTPGEALVYALAFGFDKEYNVQADYQAAHVQARVESTRQAIKKFLKRTMHSPLDSQSVDEVMKTLTNLNYYFKPPGSDQCYGAATGSVEVEQLSETAKKDVLIVVVDGAWVPATSQARIKRNAHVTFKKREGGPPPEWPPNFNFDWFFQHRGKSAKVVKTSVKDTEKDDDLIVQIGQKMYVVPKLAVEPAWQALLVLPDDQKPGRETVTLRFGDVRFGNDDTCELSPTADKLFKTHTKQIYRVKIKELNEEEAKGKEELFKRLAQSTTEWSLSTTSKEGGLPMVFGSYERLFSVKDNCRGIFQDYWIHFYDNNLVKEEPTGLMKHLEGFFKEVEHTQNDPQLVVVVLGGMGYLKPTELFVLQSSIISHAFSRLRDLLKEAHPESGEGERRYTEMIMKLYLAHGRDLTKKGIDDLCNILQKHEAVSKDDEVLKALRESIGQPKGCLVLKPSGKVAATGVKFKAAEAPLARVAALQGADILKELKTAGFQTAWTVLERSGGGIRMHAPGFDGTRTRQMYVHEAPR